MLHKTPSTGRHRVALGHSSFSLGWWLHWRKANEQVQILRVDEASEPQTPWAKLWEMLRPTLLKATSKGSRAGQALSWKMEWKAWGPGSPPCTRKARLGLRFLLSIGSQKRLRRDLGQGSLESWAFSSEHTLGALAAMLSREFRVACPTYSFSPA